jgi:hypothetical protein
MGGELCQDTEGRVWELTVPASSAEGPVLPFQSLHPDLKPPQSLRKVLSKQAGAPKTRWGDP